MIVKDGRSEMTEEIFTIEEAEEEGEFEEANQEQDLPQPKKKKANPSKFIDRECCDSDAEPSDDEELEIEIEKDPNHYSEDEFDQFVPNPRFEDEEGK